MALDSFGLFIHQSQATEGELQVKIYQILFDVLMLYGVSFLEPKGYGVGGYIPMSPLHYILAKGSLLAARYRCRLPSACPQPGLSGCSSYCSSRYFQVNAVWYAYRRRGSYLVFLVLLSE